MDKQSSMGVKAGIPKHLAHRVLGMLDDLVPMLIKDFGVDFLTCSDCPVDGAQYAILRFKFDSVVFNEKLCAALRAKGCDFSDRDRSG